MVRVFGASARGSVRAAAGLMLAWLLLIGVLSTLARAQEVDHAIDFDIAPQTLDTALVEFSQQSGIQLVVPADITRGKTTHGVQGKFVPTVALAKLLDGSGLKYSAVNARSLAIRAVGNDPAGPTGRNSDNSPSPRAGPQLAQTDALAAPGAMVGREELAVTRQRQSGGSLDEVVVTGSRIPLAVKERAVPVHTYTSEDIDRSGETTVSDFLNTLPQVSVSSPSSKPMAGDEVRSALATIAVHAQPTDGRTLVASAALFSSGIGYSKRSEVAGQNTPELNKSNNNTAQIVPVPLAERVWKVPPAP